MEAVYDGPDELEPVLAVSCAGIWGSTLSQTGRRESARVSIEEAVELLAETGPPIVRPGRARSSGVSCRTRPRPVAPLAEIARATEVFRLDGNDFGLATHSG